MAEKPWASSLAEAKRNATVNFIASSGTRWSVRPMTLDELVAANGMPYDLIRIALLDDIRVTDRMSALGIEMQQKLTAGDKQSVDEATKMSKDLVELRNRLVLASVQAPKLKKTDLAQVDPYDLAEIAAVAQHRLAVDEEGRLVDPLATFPGSGRNG